MEQKRMTAQRNNAVDWVKCLAICAVLLIHCSAKHFAGYEIGSNRWLATAFYASVSRWAVPAFLLCSGALMNDPDRDIPLKKLFSRYILRFIAALAVWAVFYELFRILEVYRGSASLGTLLQNAGLNLLYGKTYYHLYYFYFIFALYLMLPLTRLVTRFASESELRYLLVIWFLAGGVIRTFQYFWPLNQMQSSLMYFSMPVAVVCPGLGLLGWYMRCHPPKLCVGGLLLFAVGFAVTMGATWLRSVRAGELDQMFLDGFGLFVLMMAAGVFRLCQWVGARWRTPGIVLFISKASFCVYLVHPFFQYYAMPDKFLSLPVYWSLPLQAAVLLVLSLAVYLVLRKIPVVNRWLI